MKINTNPVVFLLAIVLIVCFISLFMRRKSGFEENFQDVLVDKNIKNYLDTIFQDMEKLREKCTDSKPLIDKINNNILLLENKLIEIGIMPTIPPKNTFNPILKKPTFNPILKKPKPTNKTMPIDFNPNPN